MKFRLFISCFLLLVCMTYVQTVHAHPLDVSRTELITPEDLTQTQIEFEIYVPWTAAAYLIGDQQLIASPSAQLLQDHRTTYEAYLKDHLFIINDSQQCQITTTTIPPQPDNQILLGAGLQINGTFTCPNPLGSLLISNSIFIDIFPLQTNVVNIYQGSKDKLLKGALLTATNQEDYIDLTNPQVQPQMPNDSDANSGITEKLSNQFLDIQTTSFPLALAVTFLLGLLHTLEAGHSKTVLAAMVVNRRINLRQSLIYATVFTATHVADIILMGIIIIIASSFTDIFDKLPYLQIASLYGLLFMAFYLSLKNLIEFIRHRFFHDHHHHHHDHSHELDPNQDFRSQLMVGFITGLAPCLFGWSIFMLILSTRQIWTVIPLIISFGLGIFLALITVVILIHKIKNTLISEHSLLAQLSPLISSLVLLGIALYQIL